MDEPVSVDLSGCHVVELRLINNDTNLEISACCAKTRVSKARLKEYIKALSNLYLQMSD